MISACAISGELWYFSSRRAGYLPRAGGWKIPMKRRAFITLLDGAATASEFRA
jgi:hypothetical protein